MQEEHYRATHPSETSDLDAKPADTPSDPGTESAESDTAGAGRCARETLAELKVCARNPRRIVR